MYPQDPPQADASQPLPRNPLAVMQPGEQVICEIKRHPIGILGIFFGAGLFLILIAVIGLVVAPGLVDSQNHDQVMTLGGLAFFVFAVLALIFTFISNIVYWGNRWVVTSDSITQIAQTSLFNKQSSQLSLGNLEDVTAEKKGILAQMFNFGVLKAETAGERSKFMFLYCPNPTLYAQKILAAREVFEQGHHGGKQPPYYEQPAAPEVGYASPQPSQPQPEPPTAYPDQLQTPQSPAYPAQPQPLPPQQPQQDPAYGAYQPYDAPMPDVPTPTTQYPNGATDHGVNIGTE
ncbi:MAG: hypothetical protein WA843_01905 [Candidatus Saccharimonadales bacterium]